MLKTENAEESEEIAEFLVQKDIEATYVKELLQR
jgi:hypothetical protein